MVEIVTALDEVELERHLKGNKNVFSIVLKQLAGVSKE